MEKFCYLGGMIICYGGASEALSARIGSARKKFRELSGVLGGRHGLSSKQWCKICQCCVRPVLYFCEMWKLTVVDETRLCSVEHCMIRMMCGLKLVDRALTDGLHGRVGVVMKIEDMLIQSRLWWYDNVMHRDINS